LPPLWRFVLLFVLLFITFAANALSANAASDQKFDDYIRAYVRNGDFSGSVLVARDGRVLFRKSYGMASYELLVPNAEKTRFHIGSVSKTFTAAAIVLLEKQGKLKLSDPLSKWLPDYLNGEKITVEQMLTHRSGLPDYYSLPEYAAKKSQPVTLPDLVAWVKTKPLDFLPGSESRYSNTAYAFLAYIVQQVSGKRYDEFVAQELFQPAGMKDSGTFRDDLLIPDRAAGYQPWVGPFGIRNAPAYDKTILTGAASLYSTTGDLYAWCRGLREKKLFDLTQLSYPYGWRQSEIVGPNGNKTRVLEQDGREPGFVAHVLMGSENDLVIVALGNLEDAAVNTIARDLAAMAVGDNVTPPSSRSKRPNLETNAEYAGRYEVRPDFLLDVKQDGPDLFLRGTGGNYLPLEPLGKDAFFYRQFYLTVRFKRDRAGKVDQLLWTGDYPCKKVSDKPQP
jgi:CubicO group peptidase (beta-lactamase class C family)